MNTKPTLNLCESHMLNRERKDTRRVCLIMNQKKALKNIKAHNVSRYVCIIYVQRCVWQHYSNETARNITQIKNESINGRRMLVKKTIKFIDSFKSSFLTFHHKQDKYNKNNKLAPKINLIS